MSYWNELVNKGNEYVKELGKYFQNINKDKEERTEQCLKEFSRKKIDLCHKDSSRVTNEELRKFTIERMDLTDEKLIDYCKDKFAEHEIYPCNEILIAQHAEKSTSHETEL